MRILPAIIVAAGLAAATPGPVEAKDLSSISDLWNDIKDATTCTACDAVLVVLKGLAGLGDSMFVSTVTGVCKLTNLVDDDVCEGAVKLEGPILAQDLRNMSIGSKTSTLFCTTLLGVCDYPDVAAWSVPFPSAKPSTSRPEPSGQTPIKIVQFSDTHVDPFYTTGANTNCTKPICCRPYTTSDEPGNNDSPAGANGDHNCDAPVSLEQSMFDAIKTIAPDAAFALFTGDIVDHAIWLTSEEQNTADINDMYTRVAASVPLLYGTAGNHEMSPTNAYPTVAQNLDNAAWLYSLLSGVWTQWIGDAATSTSAAQFGAYSSKYPGGNLRVISLNTNMYYVQNYWLFEKTMEQDPSGQLAWLVSELQAAEDAGERVYIMGHMPMGIPDAFHDGSNYFDQIVNRYEATIAAMFFGHTHKDEFQISYTDYTNRNSDTAMAMSYIMPSLTPTDGNPAFRVYTVDPVTFGVLDAETYIADMDASGFQTTGPTWTKYYSSKEAYGPLVTPPLTSPTAELTPAFWHNVTVALESSSDAFQAYISRKTRGWDPESCTGDCVTSTICMLRGGRAQDNCHVLTPGQNIFKRGLDANGDKLHQHRDSCGLSVSRETLSSLVGRKDLLQHVVKRAMDGGAEFKRV